MHLRPHLHTWTNTYTDTHIYTNAHLYTGYSATPLPYYGSTPEDCTIILSKDQRFLNETVALGTLPSVSRVRLLRFRIQSGRRLSMPA